MSKFDCPSITVVVLAFNEALNLPKMIDESIEYLERRIPTWEIVIVDDGSKDGTRGVAEGYAARYPNIKVVVHETNRGMGAGMKSGIRAATSDYFTIIAGDGQHPTPELESMIPGLAEADIVTTYHVNARELHRRVLSWGFRQAMWWACSIRFELEGIYLFPRRVAVEEIGLENVPPDTFFFSFELIARAMRAGHTVTVKPMIVRRREHGQSKVASASRIKRIGNEIMSFRKRLKAEKG
ncbi:MAG: glycosyltransferase involved in cell wall biosynthesis [Myxococcota bacterium]|jgi:glycosyltransferase involved in cell wall biosynthesis